MKRHLNLIPSQVRGAQEARRAMLMWAKILCVVATVTTTIVAMEYAQCTTAQARLGAMNAHFEPLAQMLKEQQEITAQIQQLEAHEQLSLRLAEEIQGAMVLGAVSSAAAKLPEQVYLTKFDFQSGGNAGAGSVRLEGAGADPLAIASFAEQLRETQLFLEVSISSTRKLPGGAPATRAFELDCVF